MDALTFYLKVDDLIAQLPGTLDGSETLNDTSLFDSLSMLELTIFMDDECGVSLRPEELIKIGTLANLYNYLFSRD